jgi:hypothetical protein
MNPAKCGAGAPARERPEAQTKLSKTTTLAAAIVRTFALIVEALKEIFDESAYQRFLLRSDMSPSAKSYAAFWAEYEKNRARRPRCC